MKNQNKVFQNGNTRGALDGYKRVYEMLEDEVSRRIYLNRLCFLISGSEQYARNMADMMAIYYSNLANRECYHAKIIKDMENSLPADRGIVLYGAGKFARQTFWLWEDDKRLIGFCSRTASKQEKGYLGRPVMSPKELLERKDLSVVVNVVDPKQRREILQILRDGNYPQNQIYTVTEDQWEFENEQYFAPDLITFGKDEIFLDVGCYDLETSLNFRRRCGHVKKVYAFEPDPKNYQTCLERREREKFPEIQLLQCGAWSTQTTLHFCAISTMGSQISSDGEIVVPVAAIDDVIDTTDRVTMIKMDIEGAELEALQGAQKTIQRDKPKLAICIYHKPEDMTDIPLYIKELVPEYRLYVRHYSNSPFAYDTVLYAIMP